MLEKKIDETPIDNKFTNACLFGYLERLHEINRRVWFYLGPVAADKRDKWWIFCESVCSIDTAWIYKTVQFNAALQWAVFWVAVFSTSRLCHVPDYSTVCKGNIVEQQITKRDLNCSVDRIEMPGASFAYQPGWSHETDLFVVLFAWFVKFSIGVAVVVGKRIQVLIWRLRTVTLIIKIKEIFIQIFWSDDDRLC